MAEQTRVIVFGPTGNVGSVTARTAHDNGAKVFLAMRDTQKPIPGLSFEQEQKGAFERVQADLSEPDTLSAVVQATGAKRAFLYLVQRTPDHMKSAIEALKTAGIEFVVFLSSSTIRGEPGEVPPSELIAYVHAQVELCLEDTFPGNYVALRPGHFATNMLQFGHGIAAGNVKLYAPGFMQDFITPNDIGRVSGTILAQRIRDGQNRIELYGPELYTQRKAIEAIGKQLNQDIKIEEIGPIEALEHWLKVGIPKPMAEYMVKKFGDTEDDEFIDQVRYKVGVKNVQNFTGQPAMTFPEWIEANREAFIV